MDDLIPQANSAPEAFGCKSCLHGHECADICIEHEQCASSDTEKTFKVMPLEDLGISSTGHKVGLMVQELGITLNGILRIHDTCEAYDCKLTPNSDGIFPQKETQTSVGANLLTDKVTCEVLDRNLTLENDRVSPQKETRSSVDTNMLTYMIKDATALCSEVVQSSQLVIDLKEVFSTTIGHIDSLLKADDTTDECSMALPATPKLVSAMKGSRAKQGAPLKAKLSVTWSPDVYDPPVTSDSHTVKGYPQRHRTKKDQHKHRHSKSKSSRSSGGDKKHAHRRSNASSIDPRILRLRAHSDGLQLNGFSKSQLEMDYAVMNPESKFGCNCCYMESLPQVHLSVAEAS